MASPCTCGKKRSRGHGSSRSLVRQIGTRLPIKTGKRIFIRIPGMDSPAGVHVETGFRNEATGQHYVPPQEGLTVASCFNNPRQLLTKAAGILDFDPMEEDWVGSTEVVDEEEMCVEEDGTETTGKKQEAIEKISALESELAKLKAQIAVYAMTEVDIGSDETDSDILAPPPPPPPPVAPPPPATPSLQALRGSSAVSSTPSAPDGPFMHPTPGPRGSHPNSSESLATPAQPGMGDVLRDIGSIKLRTVHAARSPGGTPLRPKNKGREPDPNDPASIIAQALRKKFSHRVFKDTPEKENLDRSDASLFESPTAKFLK